MTITTPIIPHKPMNSNTSGPIPVKKRRLSKIDRERGLCRRSARLPLAEALLLARRLNNLAHIQKPEVVDILTSQKFGHTAVVIWQAERSEAQEALKADFRASRLATAAKQSAVMSFYLLADQPDHYVCVNDDFHGSLHHILDLANDECDCEDFKFRCLPLGERCHHLHEAHNRKEAGTLPGLEPARRTPVPSELSAAEKAERNARCLANREQDF